jgi:hypothetical protein
MHEVRKTVGRLFYDGRVAQLGERIHGMDEVAGSIPVTSTKSLVVTVCVAQALLPVRVSQSAHSQEWLCYRLLQDLRGERIQLVVLHAVCNFNGVAAHFAIFHVSLPADGNIENHRNFLTAIWAEKIMFHEDIKLRARDAEQKDFLDEFA